MLHPVVDQPIGKFSRLAKFLHQLLMTFPTLACTTFRPPCSLQWMINRLWIRILQKRIPTSPPYHFVPNVRIHNLKPCACRVILMPGDLSVSQLFKAFSPLMRAASIGPQKEIEGVEGVFVAFAFALDELVEFRVRLDMAELERHGGKICLLCWE